MDDFDPNILFAPANHEFRIYGDDMAQTWVVVDEEDYHFLVRWRWSWKVSKNGKKRYLRRVVEDYVKGSSYSSREQTETGDKRFQMKERTQRTLFLHTVVMLRKGDAQPTALHHIPDHLDGDETNCRRENLRWATHSMNSKNKFGSALKDEAQGVLL